MSAPTLLFATGNSAKLQQFQFVADAYAHAVRIESAYDRFPDLEPYPEDPTAPPDTIARDGAAFIHRTIQQPVAVEDTVITIPYLVERGITRRYASNEYLFGRGLEGVLDDMCDADRREAVIRSAVAYHDGDAIHVWTHDVAGRITHKQRYRPGEPIWVGPTHDPMGGGYNVIVELEATGQTLAEHTAEDGLTYGYREPNFRRLLSHWAAQQTQD